VSGWFEQRLEEVMYTLREHSDAAGMACALDIPAIESGLAVQFRVLAKSPRSRVSPNSVWFHPKPVEPAAEVCMELVCCEDGGPALQIAWDSRQELDLSPLNHSPEGCAICHDLAGGRGPVATHFQLRLRWILQDDAQVAGDWRELQPEPLPQASTIPTSVASDLPYRWLLRESHWFAQVGVVLEAELRLGNALSWSCWSPGGRVLVSARPPVPPPGHALEVKAVGRDAVRLAWHQFRPGWPQLRALEYSVLCLELLAGTGTAPEPGRPTDSEVWTSDRQPFVFDGKTVYEWMQTADDTHLFIEAPSTIGKAHFEINIEPEHLRVGLKGHSPFLDEELFSLISPNRSSWMIDGGEVHIVLKKAHRGETWGAALKAHCQLLDTPLGLEASHSVMLGGAQKEPDVQPSSWQTCMVIRHSGAEADAPLECNIGPLLPDRAYLFAVEGRYLGLPARVAQDAVARLQAPSPLLPRSFHLLTGRLTASVSLEDSPSCSAGFKLKLDWSLQAMPAGARLPEALLYQIRASPRARLGSALGNEPCLVLSPALLPEQDASARSPASFAVASRSLHMGSASVTLRGSDLEPLLGARKPLELQVRLGHILEGAWSDWSPSSEAVELTLEPPVPPARASLEVLEELWKEGGMPADAAHGVRHVLLSWPPFRPAHGARSDWHDQLHIEYKVEAQAFADVGAKGAESKLDLDMTFECFVSLSPVAAEPPVKHSVQVPGERLNALRRFSFTVSARYTFADGAPVPVPLDSGPRGGLSSQGAYCPTPPPRPPASLELVASSNDDEASPSGVLLVLSEAASATEHVALRVEARAGRGRARGVAPVGEWSPCTVESVSATLSGQQLLVTDLPSKVCQFRLRRDTLVSEPSEWIDTEVWSPAVLEGHWLKCNDGLVLDSSFEAVLSALQGPPLEPELALKGLGVALCLCGGVVSAWFAWPREPPGDHAAEITRYQLRCCTAGGGWEELPAEGIRVTSSSSSVADCHVTELSQGLSYQFALRLCNELGAWSAWTAPTVAMVTCLSAPIPGHLVKASGISVEVPTPSSVRLAWRPFCIPRRPDWEIAPPILLGTGGRLAAGEYEVVVRAEGGHTVAALLTQGPLLLEELPMDVADVPWVEVEVEALEPHRSVIFELRARLPAAPWGDSFMSPLLAPRLLPIGVSTPGVEFVLRPQRGQAYTRMQALLLLKCDIQGFSAVATAAAAAAAAVPAQEAAGAGQVERPAYNVGAAKLARLQLRSSAADADTGKRLEAWSEWPDAQARAQDSPQLFEHEVPLPSPAVCRPGQYVFSLRCSDEHGRWTPWSTPSCAVSIRVPPLTVSGLRAVPLGPTDARLEWSPCAGVGALPLAEGDVEYRLHMTQSGRGSTRAIVLDGFRSDLGTGGTRQREVYNLDAHSEYVFFLAARPTNVTPWLNGYEWGPDVSVRLPARVMCS